jgi:dipeptidyl-peptidase 4
MNKIATAILLLILSCSLSGLSQKKELSFDEIFGDQRPGISRPLPRIITWTDDDHYVEIREDDTPNGRYRPMKVEAKTGKAVPYEAVEGNLSNQRAFIKNNDIYYASASGQEKKLTNNSAPEINPTLSPDGKWVAFTRLNNLYALEVASGKEIAFSNENINGVYNGYASWVYFEEILGRASRYKAFWWSPDSRHISFMRFDDREVPVFPIYNSTGQHGFLENQYYPKAGDKNPSVKLGIVSIDHPSIIWADFNEKQDQYFGEPLWTPDGKLWAQWMPRSQDNLKIFEVALNNGSKKELYNETQKTWIDLDERERITFLKSGQGFILMSDRSGWMHLYLHDNSGKEINPLTSGDFTVTGIELIDEKNKQVYFTARKENSARIDFYKTGFNGKGLTRLTFGEYSHTINPSPGGKYFITTYSNVSSPPAMALVDNKGKLVREIANSKGAQFETYDLPKTELVRVKSADGLFDLPMTITYPVNFDPAKRYPVLVSVYGGPNAGTVYDTWKPAGTITSWWASEGLIQVAMDNRSSGHFGKRGMNYIYRQVGKYEMDDYMQCGRWLRQKSFVDSSRICITGGSFGGYMTCMALTYGASVFTHGVANSSVTDWKLYDTHYTERFMDTPEENPEGYKATAVLSYIENYKGMLRIIHGTMDDNVHMQNTIQVIDKLQDLRKHFEFMLYPGERHGIGGLKGNHNRIEAYRFYYKYLLNKPMPSDFLRL